MSLTWNVVCYKCKALFEIYDDEAEHIMINDLKPDCGCDVELKTENTES